MTHPLFGKLERIYVCAGVGRGDTLLTAFDQALRNAGVGDYNLLKVSSIVPPGARVVDNIEVPKGSLLPIAYGAISSTDEGEVISAAVSVAIPLDGNQVGVIMEFSGYTSEEKAREIVKRMAEEAMKNRNLQIKEIIIKSASARIEGPTSVFAGVALW